MDDENYDEIADEDLIEAISHSPQISFASNLDKRQRRGGERLNDRTPSAQWHNFQDRYEDDISEEDIPKNEEAVLPSEKHLGVNRTDASPGSSPRRTTGPVYPMATNQNKHKVQIQSQIGYMYGVEDAAKSQQLP